MIACNHAQISSLEIEDLNHIIANFKKWKILQPQVWLLMVCLCVHFWFLQLFHSNLESNCFGEFL